MLYEKIFKYIQSYNKKRINELELRKLDLEANYLKYYNAIIKLIEDNKISPILISGPNGMNPPLHKRYTIIKEDVSFVPLIDEIRLLDTTFNIDTYLTQPSKYDEHREFIIPLDHFLKTRRVDLLIEVSINERSFQIFNLEKALKEDKIVQSILTINPKLEKVLNYYNTPEPFFTHYINSDNKNLNTLNILIIENKDTWYTLRKLMGPEKNNLFGIDFHILLYGEGKKIIRTSSSLTDFNNVILKGQESKYYYFGDLDYEGINIFTNLIINNNSLNIRLMSPLYEEMLSLSKDINLPTTKEHQRKNICEDFFNNFNDNDIASIKTILEERRYIPQEIVSSIEFSKLIKVR